VMLSFSAGQHRLLDGSGRCVRRCLPGDVVRDAPDCLGGVEQAHLVSGPFLCRPHRGSTDRTITGDIIISGSTALPATVGNNFTSVGGGFQQNGAQYPHLSAHLKSGLPQGQNIGYGDGHVAWRKFDATVISRTGVSTPYFWW